MRQISSDRRAFLALAGRLGLAAALGLAGMLSSPSPARASTLDSYRADGTIAERFDGYVELRGSGAPAAARALVADVNAQRRDLYEKRGAEMNVPASEVGKIFAPKIFDSAPSGTYFLQPGGGYVRK